MKISYLFLLIAMPQTNSHLRRRSALNSRRLLRDLRNRRFSGRNVQPSGLGQQGLPKLAPEQSTISG